MQKWVGLTLTPKRDTPPNDSVRGLVSVVRNHKSRVFQGAGPELCPSEGHFWSKCVPPAPPANPEGHFPFSRGTLPIFPEGHLSRPSSVPHFHRVRVRVGDTSPFCQSLISTRLGLGSVLSI